MQIFGYKLPEPIEGFYKTYGDVEIGGAEIGVAFTAYHFTFIAMWVIISYMYVDKMPHLHLYPQRKMTYFLGLSVLGIFLEDVIAMFLMHGESAFTTPDAMWHPFGYVTIGGLYIPILYPIAIAIIVTLLRAPRK